MGTGSRRPEIGRPTAPGGFRPVVRDRRIFADRRLHEQCRPPASKRADGPGGHLGPDAPPKTVDHESLRRPNLPVAPGGLGRQFCSVRARDTRRPGPRRRPSLVASEPPAGPRRMPEATGAERDGSSPPTRIPGRIGQVRLLESPDRAPRRSRDTAAGLTSRASPQRRRPNAPTGRRGHCEPAHNAEL